MDYYIDAYWNIFKYSVITVVIWRVFLFVICTELWKIPFNLLRSL